MPRLWTETIEAHRAALRDAALDAAAALISEQGLASVSMSRIAGETGIGRATLYKYFPDVEAILRAWHERQINGHLAHLTEVADAIDSPHGRVEAVCHAYAQIHYRMRTGHGGELAARLHQSQHVADAHQRLCAFLARLLGEAATAGEVRDDVEPTELADYCLHALTAARVAHSPEAVGRLVSLTLTGLGPGGPSGPAGHAESPVTRTTPGRRAARRHKR